MPIGFVCQLHYHGGGSLLCQSSAGDSWQLPFARAPPQVRIGQTVSFSLAVDRADLAVDLGGIKEDIAKPSATAEVGLRRIQEKAAKPASSISGQAKQPTRKLQRSITRFHNADLDERRQMIGAAEGVLSDLLNADKLDGDAICKLLCRCAGWLHGPGSFEAKHVAATEVAATETATVSQPSGPSDLQHRVRRLLISALSSLDLNDITTYQAVETAVLYILQLMQDKDIFFSGNEKSLAVRQWRQLRELLVSETVPSVSTKRKASIEAPAVLQDKAARRVSKDRSATIDGVYRPNERVRSLPSVYEAPDRVVMLKCSKCVKRISTSWFWKQPRNGRICAVVPHNGHKTCRRKMGKRCPWISLDGTDTCLDSFESLDFCNHNRPRSRCPECGGRFLCPHNLQRSQCKECGGRGICPHNRRRSVCHECGGGSICPHSRERYRCPVCKTQTRKYQR